jgi:hypothetical protein
VVFAVAALLLYRGALQGPLLSDDHGYITTNPFTASLSMENVVAIFDPWGDAKLYTANYAPIHLTLHALERQIFADHVFGYHLVNVLVHALSAVLLVALLRASQISPPWALMGGLLFLVHPANVEAVAWVSQLKTNACVALAFAALLLHRRHPALGAPVFALALLTKATAAFALPMALGLTWARQGAGVGDGRQWRWLVAWALILILFAVPQFASFQHLGAVDVEAYDDRLVHLRSVAAIGARYLAMALTSYGVSAYHEPLPVLSWLDPWWLASIPLVAILAWRLVGSLGAQREEAGWWLGAAAAWFPVSQVFPFLIPLADRYLYAILPCLIGGLFLWMRDAAASRSLERAGLVVAAGLAVVFAVQTDQRARLWRGETFLLLDAATHYPDGATARFMNARSAAQQGDADTAVRELRAAAERGLDTVLAIRADPGLAPIAHTAAFRALIDEMAARWIGRANERGATTQAELRALAHMHLVREELGAAITALERALESGGLQDATVRAELENLRAHAAKSGGGDFTPSP